ncbi:MAG: hypothetical protein QM820_34245 [Minicystis sp.]
MSVLRLACFAGAVALALIGGCQGSAETGTGGSSSTTSGTGGDSCVTVAPPAGYPTCRTDDDCEYDHVCVEDPSEVATCAPNEAATFDCVTDVDCAADEVCEPYTLSGPCVDPTQSQGRQCVPSCTAASCDPGSTCGTDGRCQPDQCTDSFSCGADSTCSPSDSAADAHGCAPLHCTDGYVCPAETVCESYAPQHGCVPQSCYDGYVCAGETTCAPSRTDADAHGCAPPNCAEGYTCPANTRCDPESPYPRGCVDVSCQTDADCDCGFCVGGWCKLGLSVCVELVY